MKKIFILMMLLLELVHANAFSQAIRSTAKIFGTEGVHATEKMVQKLSVQYGDDVVGMVLKTQKRYGTKGLSLLERYGSKSVVASPNAFKLVDRYGDKGYYLLTRYAQAPALYGKFGSRYVDLSEKFGAKRVSEWLAQADAKGKGKEILNLLEKYGTKAVHFFERNWGKLLVSGFVLGNSETLIAGGVDVGKHTLDVGKDVVVEGAGKVVKVLVDSPLVYAVIFAIMAYTLLTLFIKWQTYRSQSIQRMEEQV